MRTTIELPDELMTRAKIRAATDGITLRELFVSAVENRLAAPTEKKRHRFGPPIIDAPDFRQPTPEEFAEAALPIGHLLDQIDRNRR